MLSEDYIQTLGVNFMEKAISIRNTEITFSVGALVMKRGALWLKDADMGPWRTARVRLYAAVGLQRCCRHLVHVRLDAQDDVEQCEGVVQAGPRFQQGSLICFQCLVADML